METTKFYPDNNNFDRSIYIGSHSVDKRNIDIYWFSRGSKQKDDRMIIRFSPTTYDYTVFSMDEIEVLNNANETPAWMKEALDKARELFLYDCPAWLCKPIDQSVITTPNSSS